VQRIFVVKKTPRQRDRRGVNILVVG
jgi:hypothetical protein